MSFDLPRETLISLVQQRERELSKLQDKIKAGDSAVNRLKLMSKDRRTFLAFAKCMGVVDSELIFESALAQHVPVDLRNVDNCFLKFLRLVFGDNDSDIENMQNVGEFDWNLLQSKWDKTTLNTADLTSAGSVATTSFSTNPFEVFDAQIRAQQAQIEFLESRAKKRPVTMSAATQTSALAVSTVSLDTGDLGTLEETNRYEQLLAEQGLEIHRQKELCVKLENEISLLQAEKESFSFVEEMALKQAHRDLELNQLRRELESAKCLTNTDLDSMSQKEFFKNLIIRFISYSVTADYGKMTTLVPVLKQVLSLSDSEAADLASVCQPPRNPIASLWVP